MEQIDAVSMPSRPDMISVLEDQGYRVTAPRRSIVNLLDLKEGGFTVEEIACELPKVGRATVYRTIKLLMDAGVVCRVALPDGTPKYSLARIEHHHHTVCVSCGNVGEFSADMIEGLIRSIGKDMAGEIVGHRMEFHIVCEACAETEGCVEAEECAESEGCVETEACAETCD